MRARVLSRSVACAVGVVCAAVLVSSGQVAQAGINVWTSQGPTGGLAPALAIDPLSPSTIYAGTYGGVFKSTDGGGTWRPASSGLHEVLALQGLAIDSGTPRTLYAGTEDGGVFKSTDAASTWSPASTGLPDFVGVRALAIDPLTPGALYAGTFGGGVFAIEQVDASPTPTPVATQTPTPTPSSIAAGGGGGGCALTPRGVLEGDTSAYLLVPLLVLLWVWRQQKATAIRGRASVSRRSVRRKRDPRRQHCHPR